MRFRYDSSIPLVFSRFVMAPSWSSLFFFLVHLLFGVDVEGHSFALRDFGYACFVFGFVLGVFFYLME